MIGFHIRRGEKTQRHRGRRPVRTETEVGVIHLQAKEHQRLMGYHAKLGRGKEELFPRAIIEA